MRYLITHPDHKPFLTDWFDYDNNWIEGYVIYHLIDQTFTTDGLNWEDIIIDSL